MCSVDFIFLSFVNCVWILKIVCLKKGIFLQNINICCQFVVILCLIGLCGLTVLVTSVTHSTTWLHFPFGYNLWSSLFYVVSLFQTVVIYFCKWKYFHWLFQQPAYTATVMVPQTPTMYHVAPQYSAYQPVSGYEGANNTRLLASKPMPQIKETYTHLVILYTEVWLDESIGCTISNTE